MKKKDWLLLVLILLSVSIHIYSLNPTLVEFGYSTKYYPFISGLFRWLFGWLPFSIGDFLWGMLVLFIIRQIYIFIKFLFRKKESDKLPSILKQTIVNIGIFGAAVYIVFNVLWGLNYNRLGVAEQLHLAMDKYNLQELKDINAVLVKKVNSSKQTIIINNIAYPDNDELFTRTQNAYREATNTFPFLQYNYPSIKKSMWGWVGNYAGFLGYYNPLTGEAQVNTSVPKFTQPFTACHEVAHQLGYAKEMEANFVGYLAAANSLDTLFRYSVYTDLFSYANRTLYYADTTAAVYYRKQLLPSVIIDFKERQKFYLSHTGFFEPYIRSLYGLFLKSNQQPMGLLSYDEVTSFIIAYHKKFGII